MPGIFEICDKCGQPTCPTCGVCNNPVCSRNNCFCFRDTDDETIQSEIQLVDSLDEYGDDDEYTIEPLTTNFGDDCDNPDNS